MPGIGGFWPEVGHTCFRQLIKNAALENRTRATENLALASEQVANAAEELASAAEEATRWPNLLRTLIETVMALFGE